MNVILFITTVCLLVPVYVYFGYPAILWLLTRNVQPKPTPATFSTETSSTEKNNIEIDNAPTVTLVISCYNEAAVIEKKLNNALALDYPTDKLNIVVVSDGSDDSTDEKVKALSNPRIKLIRQEGRLGKTMGINLAMEQIRSQITVFSDANAMYAPDAISRLAENFDDPKVGYAVGAALYTDANSGASANNENLYWRYELAIKEMESKLHSVVGGDGAIYAIRTELWEPLQQQDINDFVNPLQIVAKGYRGVFDPKARCYEETAGDFGREVVRKERIVNRSIRGLMRVKAVMNPRKTGVFAWEVISHKLLRWLIPVFLVLGVAGSALLAAQGLSLFQLITFGSLALLALATAGHLSKNKNDLPVWLSVPYYFVLVNAYSVRGVLSAVRGETQVTWNSARPAAPADSGAVPENPMGALTWWVVGLILLLSSLGWAYVG
ncbi:MULTISPECIES: glycosyltransferase family 2 protein [unclassified Marinobacter]|uniref:glycosyltransferase family 2 protein n=1 Tax=unclassified Marinobacter TaxID=83889 RepID=UPI00200D7ED1|nr:MULTISPECIES: glycosyltransferase family 2 protein [unclassified Marinobacter]UQG54171.1 glycosyltransferase family 2 protein [Marinobacter sp. M4C]UQG62978.1 glycosyltransferase family 2 protein [Marinobacter sp. M2C]UQG67256.1 glycosyltransferase family 2 protein [Marinobacter sp. M1C]